MKTETDAWEPAPVPEQIRAELIKQIIRGTVDRAAFPDLWPAKRIIVILPEKTA